MYRCMQIEYANNVCIFFLSTIFDKGKSLKKFLYMYSGNFNKYQNVLYSKINLHKRMQIISSSFQRDIDRNPFFRY